MGTLEIWSTYLHSICMSITADRSWRLLALAHLSVKSEDQQAHYQRREHEDERSHEIPVDRLRVAYSWHRTVTRPEQEDNREHGRDSEGDSVSYVVTIHPEHDPAHYDHDYARYIEIDQIITDSPAECECDDHVSVFT